MRCDRPPKESAIEAVKSMQQAGIRVKMITGDHPLTAKAIAKQLGIAKSSNSNHRKRAESTVRATMATSSK